jgi:hypothetical protein
VGELVTALKLLRPVAEIATALKCSEKEVSEKIADLGLASLVPERGTHPIKKQQVYPKHVKARVVEYPDRDPIIPRQQRPSPHCPGQRRSSPP